jgi:hypothetical protein
VLQGVHARDGFTGVGGWTTLSLSLRLAENRGLIRLSLRLAENRGLIRLSLRLAENRGLIRLNLRLAENRGLIRLCICFEDFEDPSEYGGLTLSSD